MDDPELNARLRDFGVNHVEPDSALGEAAPELLRGWRVALDRVSRQRDGLEQEARTWVEETMQAIAATPATDATRAFAAEVEAALRLSWVAPVQRVKESKGPSVDFRVGEMNVEVSCPQEHTYERAVVTADLKQQLEKQGGEVRVAVAIGRPTIGSGRAVDASGCIKRNPKNLALKYPANKLIDRLLHKKRAGDQFREGQKNILWLDLKHGLQMRALDCVPFRSEVTKGTCFWGTHGIWHAFYGKAGAFHLPERSTLEFPGCATTYEQKPNGWFRELGKVSAALLSVIDGVLLFENPWANVPLGIDTRTKLVRLSEFRPESSWFGSTQAVEQDVESVLAKLSWLVELVDASAQEASE